MIAENTGASSRVSDAATRPPTRPSALKARSAWVVWRASTMPLKVPVSATMKIDWTPMNSVMARICDTRNGGRQSQITVRPVRLTMLPRLSSQ